MTTGDTVQIRQVDVTDYWIYATVIDPATRQVQVKHPGNVEHGAIKIVAAQDLRTKADVQTLVAAAQAMATGARLTDAQINTLAASDGWFNQFKKLEGKSLTAAQQREKLQNLIVGHYQSQVKQLS
jgi:hypothetical protein